MVIYNQRGYVGASMSIRAAEAYENGEKPASKWTKQAMLDRLETTLDEGVTTIDYKDDTDNGDTHRFTKPERAALASMWRSLPKKALFASWMRISSWHHTSRYANRTDFYDVDTDQMALCVHLWRCDGRTRPLVEYFKERTRLVLNGDYSQWRLEGNTPAEI